MSRFRRPKGGDPIITSIEPTETISPQTATTFSAESTGSFPTETTFATSAAFTQAPIITESASELNTSISPGSRNIIIGVGVGVFLVLIGTLIYFYRQKKGLDDDKSTLKIDDNYILPEKDLPSIIEDTTSNFPRQLPEGYSPMINNYPVMISPATPPPIAFDGIYRRPSEISLLHPYQGMVDIYPDPPMYDNKASYLGPSKQLFDQNGFLID